MGRMAKTNFLTGDFGETGSWARLTLLKTFFPLFIFFSFPYDFLVEAPALS